MAIATDMRIKPWWRLHCAIGLLLMNTLLTFENALPGIGVRFSPRLSFELCVMVGALMVWVAVRGRPSGRAVSVLASAFGFLVLVRYADVTVPAVFGRPVNLYWDGRHGFDALLLSLQAVPAWQVGFGASALLFGLYAMHQSVRWSLMALATALQQQRARPLAMTVLSALALSFLAYEPGVRDTRWFFSLPVSATIVRQATLLPAILAPRGSDAALPASPAFTGNVAALRGADVLLIFAESYGVTSFDDPAKAAALQGARAGFEQAIASSGRGVVSARVRSPTFAGGSWLAHATLLSGIDTKEPGAYDTLLASRRPTLVSHFRSHGYRTIGWMPGLQKPWPEGAFYGFDRVAGINSIGYSGLDFGYWRVPDQASLALLQEQELDSLPRLNAAVASTSASASSSTSTPTPTPTPTPTSLSASAHLPSPATRSIPSSRQPRFVVFPTLGTHVPFRPLAPYLANWSRATRPDAYSPDQVHDALAAPVSWEDAVPAYVDSLRYQYAWLGGYLQHRAPRRMTMIIIGDHQPLAAVSGRDASWEVPVHIVSDDPKLLRHFQNHGFASGLAPPDGTLAEMSELTHLLLEVFSDPSG